MSSIYSVSPKGITVPTLKDKSKFIPWSFIKKEKLTRGLHKLTVSNHKKELYLVDMVLNKVRFNKLVEEERDALKFIDIALIKSGREPKYIFKKQIKN